MDVDIFAKNATHTNKMYEICSGRMGGGLSVSGENAKYALARERKLDSTIGRSKVPFSKRAKLSK